jgi:hypothetical protein
MGKLATQKMREQLDSEGQAYIEKARKTSDAYASAGEWDKARSELTKLKDKVQGVTELESSLDSALTALANAEKKGLSDKRADDDKKAKKAAEDKAKLLIDQRNFADAADVLDLAALDIHSPSLQKELELHAERLRFAGSKVKEIVAAVQARPKAFTHGGAPADDATEKRIVFKGPGGAVTVTFAEVSSKELHRWAQLADGAHPDADALIHRAALAIETDAKDLAVADLNTASDVPGLTARQQEHIEALRAAAAK